MSGGAALEFLTGELRTGRRLTHLPVAGSSSWSCVLNGPGGITAVVPVRDWSVRQRAELKAQTEPTRTFLAVQAGEAIVEAGPIWKRRYDGNTGVVEITAAGLWSLFDYRLVVKVLAGGETYQGTALTYRNLSLGTIAKRLVQATMGHAGGDLPIILPADEPGSHERTYPGFELGVLADRLRQLTEVIGGPDIAFQPRLTEDRQGIEWVMRTGTTGDPLLHQVGDPWVWDAAAVRGGLSAVTVEEDGALRVNRAFAVGSGFRESILLGVEENPDQWAAGYPLLEQTASHTSVERQPTLDGHAAAMIESGLAPWVTYAMTVHAGSPPRLGTYRPGDVAALNIPEDHEWLRAGMHHTRIAEFSGTAGSDFVDLRMVPEMETRIHG